ncbi:MAG: hypothetical protein GX797_05635 [Chloroflexi bacterium]|jgi:Icc-related predicted phosphoesterase|nr:hypothetical protein [Chloroflexota bacterium]
MIILGLSDLEEAVVYSPNIKERFSQIDLVISCGDLAAGYLEYVISMLDIPLYFVQGNHVYPVEMPDGEIRSAPDGGVNLHRNVVYDRENDLILAGIEGSLRYNFGPYQYTQQRMWNMVYRLVPRLLLNKLRYGRYLDVFVTHAAATGIHDEDDHAHQGVDAFRWVIDTFKPRLHLHGHVHVYNPLIPRETLYKSTRVINTYGYREITL